MFDNLVRTIVRLFGHFRLILPVVGAGLAVCLFAAACGDDDNASTATATPPEQTIVAPSPEASLRPTTQAPQEREWSFRGQRGITAVFAPADVALYRSLLPSAFDMPDNPLVAVTIVSYYDVTAPLTPYREGFVVLQCSYQGQMGFYVLTMPVDDQTANDGGRFLGFPKYVANSIEMEEADAGWGTRLIPNGRMISGGKVVREGRTVFSMTFSPGDSASEATTPSGTIGPPVFTLVPPGEGPRVYEIGFDLGMEQRAVSVAGLATIEVDDSEAWAGLVPPDASFGATFDEKIGEWVLVATQR